MKAVVRTKFGPPEVLEFRDIETPAPNSNQMLVKVRAGTVTAGDVTLRSLSFPLSVLIVPLGRIIGYKYMRRKIGGVEWSGEVVEVGFDVTRFKVGDPVFGTTTNLPRGANAEYVCLPEKWKGGVVALKPSNLSFDEAAALPVGAMTAWYLLRKANIKEGQKILVYGASGSVGTYAVQIAKHLGTDVTGVCSAANLEMVKSLGAVRVIDYTTGGVAYAGERYDVVFDAVGKVSSKTVKHVLKAGGEKLSVKAMTSEDTDALEFLRDLAELDKIRPVIERQYPFEEIVEAHRHVDTGRKKGNVVLTFKP